MANFNLGALSEWQHLEPGEVVPLDVGAAGSRRVDLDLIVDGQCGVFVTVEGLGSFPVASGDGWLSVSFTVDAPASFHVMAHAETSILLRTKARSQEIPASDEPSFTTIEPRPSGPAEEVRRMMRIMHLNQERRMAELRAEIAAMKPAEAAQRLADVIEKDEPPAAESVPPADAKA